MIGYIGIVANCALASGISFILCIKFMELVVVEIAVVNCSYGC